MKSRHLNPARSTVPAAAINGVSHGSPSVQAAGDAGASCRGQAARAQASVDRHYGLLGRPGHCPGGRRGARRCTEPTTVGPDWAARTRDRAMLPRALDWAAERQNEVCLASADPLPEGKLPRSNPTGLDRRPSGPTSTDSTADLRALQQLQSTTLHEKTCPMTEDHQLEWKRIGSKDVLAGWCLAAVMAAALILVSAISQCDAERELLLSNDRPTASAEARSDQ